VTFRPGGGTGPDPGRGPNGDGAVVAVERALALLTAVSANGGLRLSEAGRELGLPASTVHRLLRTLEVSGFVSRGVGQRTYVPGPSMLSLAADREQQERELVQASVPYLGSLVDEFGETAHVVVLRGTTVRFIAGAESRRVIRAGLRLGVEYPAHCTSGGKAMLALVPEPVLRAIYPHEQLAGLTPTSCTSRAELFAQLRDERESRGYFCNSSESEDGITGVGAAIVDRAGLVRGALVVGGPSSRITAADVEMIGASLKQAVRQIATQVGYRGG
jgi:DNA-binding IclR family transcriptional regulator